MSDNAATAEKKKLDLFLPCPPSVNSYYVHTKRGAFISEKGRQFRALTKMHVMSHRANLKLKDPLRVVVIFSPPDRRKRDADNICKCLLDSLMSAEVLIDDSQILDLRVIKLPFGKGVKGCLIGIETVTEDEILSLSKTVV